MDFSEIMSSSINYVKISEVKPAVYYSGNLFGIYGYDLEKESHHKIISTDFFANRFDFRGNKIVIAGDSTDIASGDVRDMKNSGLKFKGHLDYNFDIKFIDD